MKLVDQIGKVYGRLLVIDLVLDVPNRKIKYVYAHCECGKIKEFILNNLQRGLSKSCGCLNLELRKVRGGKVKYGFSRHPLRHVWGSMMDRCYDVNSLSYKNYGGRGIFVCDEWKTNITAFYNWAMANGWANGLEIDRINNNLGYSPENCRFVTPYENSRNKRNNIWIEFHGERKILKDWAVYFGVSYKQLHKKIKYRGFTFINAIKSMRNDLQLES